MTVALYVGAFEHLGQVAWAFVAPEVGQHGGEMGVGQAEHGLYRATYEALQWALLSGYEKVLVHTDHQELACALGMPKAPKDSRLRHEWSEVRALEGCFFRVAYFWVDPESNTQAHQLARHIYEQHTGIYLGPGPDEQVRSVELVELEGAAHAKGLKLQRSEEQGFVLWLANAGLDMLWQLTSEQAKSLTLRLQGLTQAELFRLRVQYLCSLVRS